MTYKVTSKRRKIWSMQANAAKEKRRMRSAEHQSIIDFDPSIRIEITRKATGEHVVFECLEGSRIDNYSIYCNDKHIGVMGVSKLMQRISKALPSFRVIR